MNTEIRWGIIGLGWLGTALATFLNQHDIPNWGTKSSDFNWENDPFPTQHCDILFLNTPPLRQIPPSEYVAKIPHVDNRRILFVSSISVYGKQRGVVTESAVVAPETESAKWLVEVENLLQEKFRKNLTILRAGGLMGGDRHPIFSLSKSSRTVNADSPINMIHRDDLVQIIYALSQGKEAPPVVNAVCPYHPRKKDFYDFWSMKLSLPALNYSTNPEAHKIVSSDILAQMYPIWLHPKLGKN